MGINVANIMANKGSMQALFVGVKTMRKWNGKKASKKNRGIRGFFLHKGSFYNRPLYKDNMADAIVTENTGEVVPYEEYINIIRDIGYKGKVEGDFVIPIPLPGKPKVITTRGNDYYEVKNERNTSFYVGKVKGNLKLLRCYGCGEVIMDNDYVETVDTSHIYSTYCGCDGCYQCDECGNYFDRDIYTAENDDDHHICHECFENSEDFFKCGYCDEIVYDPDHDRIYCDGYGDVCNDCVENGHFYYCEDCSEWYHEDDIRYVESVDRYVCDDCLDRYYYRCDHCDEYFEEDDIYTDENGDHYCESCRDRGYGDWGYDDDDYDSEGLRGYHDGRGDDWREIGTYGMSFLGNDRETDPHIGCENEIDEGGESNHKAYAIRNEIGEDYVITSRDGSLANGFEIVSCPADLYNHRFTIDWKAGFDKARELGYTSHDNGRCGLHTHIDRTFFEDESSDDVECKFVVLFRNNLWWLRNFSRRDDRNPNRSEPWFYCKPNGEEHDLRTEDILDKETVKKKEFLRSMKGQGHYIAMNMEHDNTIELRFFRGTLKYNTFIATLELVDMWARLVKGKTIEDVTEIKLGDFIAMAVEREYDEFLKYLDERHISVDNEPRRKRVRFLSDDENHYIDYRG